MKTTKSIATKAFAVNSKISWKWLGRSVHGVVKSVHKKPISKVIKGKTIKRNGSDENPAYVVQSEAGNLALKLHTELSSAKKSTSKAKSPKMFQE